MNSALASGHRGPGGIPVAGAGVGMTAGNLPAAGHRRGRGTRPVVRAACRQDAADEARGVGGGHGRILVTVEDDQRQRPRREPGRAQRALPHRCQRRGQVAGGGVGQSGVDADGGVQIGVDRGHHRGHRAPGGKPRHIHPFGIYVMALHDLGGDPGDERRLAGVAPLMTGGKPVPVPARVRRAGLLGVGDQEGLTLGEVIHGGGSGEGRRVLGAAVQHHDQRHRGAGRAARDVEPVGAGTSRARVGEGVKPAPCPLGGRRRGPAGEDGTRRAAAGEGAEAASPAGRGRPRTGQGLLNQRGCLGPAGRRSQAVRPGVVIAAAQAVRAARTAFTAAGARKAPRTSTDAIVARAS